MPDWFDGQLSDAIASLDAGVSVNAEDRPHGAGEIGVLKTSAISGGAFLPKQNKTVVEHERRLASESVNGDSILVSRMNTPALVGESCYVADPYPSLFLPDRLWQLKPKHRSSVNMRWLSFVLQSSAYRSYVDVHATGTSGSMKNLPKSRLLAFPVRYPSLTEQAKIAEILDTCDAAIQTTEALIDNLKALKQGLLHDLLTRGIDANGRLRPPQAEAPHLYVSSHLGWIPKDWQIGPLSSRVASLDAGVSVNSENRPHGAGEIGVLKTSALSGGEFHPSQNKAVVANEVCVVREAVLGDSLLVSRMNTPELVGESCYVSDPWPNLFLPDRIWQLKKVSPHCVDMRWLSFVFLTSHYRAYVEVHSSGTSGSMKSLPKARLLEMPVAFPTVNEQKAIALRVDALAKHAASELGKLDKLKAQKSALMDDLLTGRVRVTPLLKSASA